MLNKALALPLLPDWAVVESFFGTLKMERVHHVRYQTREEAMTDIFFYIESFYNRRRRCI